MQPPQTDEQLMQGFYGGDPAALNELAARHDKLLAGFLLAVTRDPQVAEELLDNLWAEILLTQMENRDRYSLGRCPVLSWLMALAGHLAYLWLTGKLCL